MGGDDDNVCSSVGSVEAIFLIGRASQSIIGSYSSLEGGWSSSRRIDEKAGDGVLVNQFLPLLNLPNNEFERDMPGATPFP